MSHIRPIFIPLQARFFEEIESGLKSVEYRRAGWKWNVATCFVGRAVTLSYGYTSRRLSGVIVSSGVIARADAPIVPELYPDADQILAIGFRLDPKL